MIDTISRGKTAALGMAGVLLTCLGGLGQAAASGLHVVATTPSAIGHTAAGAPKQKVSPYARAAAAQARAAQASNWRTPTTVQTLGRPHRPRGAGGAR